MTDPNEPGVAGRGARQRYDRLRSEREARARERLGTLRVVVARLAGTPQHIEAWRIGAEGEERVARRLAMHLQRKGVELLHDRRMPLSQANIDHLAVGPGGVTVVDAKNLTGKVRVISQGGLFTPREHRLHIGGRDRTKLVESVERQIEVVRHALGELDAPGVGVAGALCFADGRGLPWRRLHVRGVLIDAPRRVAELASRTGDLHPEDVLRLRDGLARLFPAA